MTPFNHLRSTAAPSASRRGGALTVILVLLVVAAGAWHSGILNGIFEGDTEVEIDGAPVRSGPLRISEVVRGNLEASDSVTPGAASIAATARCASARSASMLGSTSESRFVAAASQTGRVD